MKTIHIRIFISILLLIPKVSKAQKISDTVNVYIDNRLEMKLVLEDYELLKIDSVRMATEQKLKQFQSAMGTIGKNLSIEKAELISISEKEEITVREDIQKEVYLLKDGELKNSGVRDQAVLKTKDVEIYLTAVDLSKAIDLNMESCLQQMVDSLPAKSRFSRSLYFECKDGKVTYIEDKTESLTNGDVLELSLGGGANLYKGYWLGEISFRMDFRFFTKNVLTSNPYLSANLLYDFRDINRVKMNTFLNLGYSWDRSRGNDKENLFGVEVGYLIDRNGDLFEENTSRIGINWSPIKGVVVSPQMYIIGGFEKVQPGMRIGLGF